AITIGRRLRMAHLVIWPTWFLGKASCCLGDYGRAMGLLDEAAKTCDRVGDRAWKSRILNTLGWCLAEIGSADRAHDCNRQSSALGRELGDAEIVANAEINLGASHLARGDVDRALVHIEPIRESLAVPGDPWMRWRYSLHLDDALGRVALARGEPERALALARKECAAAQLHRAPKIEARGLELAGRALVALEDREEARRALEAAIGKAREIGHPRVSWQALGLLAELEAQLGRIEAVRELEAEQHSLVERAAGTLADEQLRRQLRDSILKVP
ncbi:MAG TPA: hypothetical protein VEI94_06505, partial [Candidatus Bathyarchaeia archaeon]|nr:hypothetical protein [Candidatus Bathyarchaeia archaeon]